MTNQLELDEIQGLILSGYGERPSGGYALFEVVDCGLARKWLFDMLPSLQFGDYRVSPRGEAPYLNALCANIAFTHSGFDAMGLDRAALRGFSHAFQEGIAEPSRARRLGDDGGSAPELWAWGRPEETLHGVLAVFGGSDDATPDDDIGIRTFIDGNLIAANGVRLVHFLPTMPSDRTLRKEHFGFRDGIANPSLASLAKGDRTATDTVADGEFILGYSNGYGRLPTSPEVASAADPDGILPKSAVRAKHRDFGKNGSYLVFRQLHQNVQAFWKFVHEAKKNVPEAPSGPQGTEWMAAKLVGRWPNGTPLSLFPEAPGPDDRGDEDHFLFGENDDRFGTKCPIGSHVRRTNPRDTSLPVPHDPELSAGGSSSARKRQLKFVNLHRLLRRGRLYGRPLDPAYEPEAMRNATVEGDDERGLYFLCINANLSRQFEFVQSNWAGNPTFAGLSRDPDPIISAERTCPFRAAEFTIQGLPPRRVHGLRRFVETRGAAYFFLPSRSALAYLASL